MKDVRTWAVEQAKKLAAKSTYYLAESLAHAPVDLDNVQACRSAMHKCGYAQAYLDLYLLPSIKEAQLLRDSWLKPRVVATALASLAVLAPLVLLPLWQVGPAIAAPIDGGIEHGSGDILLAVAGLLAMVVFVAATFPRRK